MKQLVLAGGCFWGMEELFKAHRGVKDTQVGYTGGVNNHPTYEFHPGHAEALQITYDEDVSTIDTLLDYFFQVHDPTTLNRQGNDVGGSYRSTIFYTDMGMKQDAEQAIIRNQQYWEQPIVTTLEPLSTFWVAEDYHQEYLQRFPGGYTCHYERAR